MCSLSENIEDGYNNADVKAKPLRFGVCVFWPLQHNRFYGVSFTLGT